MTNEDVKRAIEVFQKHLDEASTIVGHKPDCKHCEASRLAITALKAQQQPTTDEVQRAIAWVEYHETQYACTVPEFATILTALRQYRTEPCEWCKRWKNWSEYPESVPWSFDDNGLAVCWEFKFCPSCGEQLGE